MFTYVEWNTIIKLINTRVPIITFEYVRYSFFKNIRPDNDIIRPMAPITYVVDELNLYLPLPEENVH